MKKKPNPKNFREMKMSLKKKKSFSFWDFPPALRLFSVPSILLLCLKKEAIDNISAFAELEHTWRNPSFFFLDFSNMPLMFHSL